MNISQEYIFTETVLASNENRLALIKSIIDFFSKKRLSPTIDQYEFYLVLDEAISNAMEHGNKWNPEKKVTVSIQVKSPTTVMIFIKDEGEGFDPNSIPSNQGKGLTSLRGRGIFIIKKFCKVDWNEAGNCVSLSIEVENKAKK